MNPIILKSIHETLEEYQQHLIGTVGAAEATIQRWRFHVRQFLEAQFKEAASLDWSTVSAPIILRYFLEQSRRSGSARLQAMASALRSFLRFLCLSNRGAEDLALGIPQIGSSRSEELPGYLSEEQLEQLLKSMKEEESPIGLRDYTLVLCLARLGLRAGELAQLTLDDIDWAQGLLSLARTKGRRERRLPLPAEVGRAIVKYLRQSRPDSSDRHLFLSRAAGQPMSADAISKVVTQGLKRAGILTPRKGAHLLRRTLASHLVQRGVSLKHIADLLGHRSLNTTTVYAKVNLPMLQQAAMPWPTEATR